MATLKRRKRMMRDINMMKSKGVKPRKMKSLSSVLGTTSRRKKASSSMPMAPKLTQQKRTTRKKIGNMPKRVRRKY